MPHSWNKKSKPTPWSKKQDDKPYSGASRHSDQDFYNSRRWRGVRKSFLIRNPLCKHCKKQGRTVEATVVDHIKAIQDGGLEWDWNNFQALCVHCHAKKTNQEIAARKKASIGQ